MSGTLGARIKNLIFKSLSILLGVSFLALPKAMAWQYGLGVGPNFTQEDAVNDQLKSDIGVSLWARRSTNDSRFFPQVTFDYFKFGGGARMENLMFGLGYLMGENENFRHDVVLGLGIGHAVRFPNATPDQNRMAAQARYNIEYKWKPNYRIGIALEFIAIDLDDKLAKDAQVSLPMIYLAWSPKSDSAVVARDLDTDQDGVRDRRDHCVKTPLGSVVNKFGCVEKEKIQMNVMVNFQTDSDVIPESDFQELSALAEILQENPKATVIIEGHTDSVGEFKYNMDLSARRAASVKQHLVEKHRIQMTRVSSKGFGPTQPVETNDSSDGRSKNRRVLAVFEPNDK